VKAKVLPVPDVQPKCSLFTYCDDMTCAHLGKDLPLSCHLALSSCHAKNSKHKYGHDHSSYMEIILDKEQDKHEGLNIKGYETNVNIIKTINQSEHET